MFVQRGEIGARNLGAQNYRDAANQLLAGGRSSPFRLRLRDCGRGCRKEGDGRFSIGV
jgi:hypothetical protein